MHGRCFRNFTAISTDARDGFQIGLLRLCIFSSTKMVCDSTYYHQVRVGSLRARCTPPYQVGIHSPRLWKLRATGPKLAPGHRPPRCLEIDQKCTDGEAPRQMPSLELLKFPPGITNRRPWCGQVSKLPIYRRKMDGRPLSVDLLAQIVAFQVHCK